MDEYLRLCRDRAIPAMTNMELKKIKIKDLQVEVLRVAKLPMNIKRTEYNEQRYKNVGKTFAKFNIIVAGGIENKAPSFDYEAPGLKDNMVASHEQLEEIGEELFGEYPVLGYLDDPLVKFAMIWGYGVSTTLQKKKPEISIDQQLD